MFLPQTRVSVDQMQFKDEKRRALVRAYAALRERIVQDWRKVMTTDPRPSEWVALFGTQPVAENSERELLTALDRAFQKEIAALEAA